MQIHFDTKNFVSKSVQTDLNYHTASEMKLSDGETKHVTDRRLEKVCCGSSCVVSCFLQNLIERGFHLSITGIRITCGYKGNTHASWITRGLSHIVVYFINTVIDIQN